MRIVKRASIMHDDARGRLKRFLRQRLLLAGYLLSRFCYFHVRIIVLLGSPFGSVLCSVRYFRLLLTNY